MELPEIPLKILMFARYPMLYAIRLLLRSRSGSCSISIRLNTNIL